MCKCNHTSRLTAFWNPNSVLGADEMLQVSIADYKQSAAAAGAQFANCDPGKQYSPSAVARHPHKWQEASCDAYECRHPCMAAPPSPLGGGVHKRSAGECTCLSKLPPACLSASCFDLFRQALTLQKLSTYAVHLMRKTAYMMHV